MLQIGEFSRIIDLITDMASEFRSDDGSSFLEWICYFLGGLRLIVTPPSSAYSASSYVALMAHKAMSAISLPIFRRRRMHE